MRISSSILGLVAGVTLLAVGCGKNSVQSSPPPKPTPTGSARLVVFGAGYCTICKVRFPEIQAQLDRLSPGERERIAVELLLTAGDPASVRPTDEMAADYARQHGLKGVARADVWRWQMFRSLIGPRLEVPAAAILDAKGNVQRIFTAGDTTFVPQEIVAVAQEVSQQGGTK